MVSSSIPRQPAPPLDFIPSSFLFKFLALILAFLLQSMLSLIQPSIFLRFSLLFLKGVRPLSSSALQPPSIGATATN